MRRKLPLWLMLAILFGRLAFPVRAADPDAVSPLASYIYFDTLADPPSQPNIVSPLVSYLYHDSIATPPEQPNVVSPLVSYLFHDSLATPPAQPNVVSPLVSYLYYDWLGNDNLTFQTSPTVSYFYQGGANGGSVAFQGRVMDGQAQPIGQVVVEARVMDLLAASASTGVDGRYTLPSLPAGTYALSAVKAGWLSDRRVVALSGATMQQNLLLRPLLGPPSLTVAGSTPPFIPPPDDAQGSVLKIFDGTAFVANPSLVDRSKMTVVLTHGWSSSPDEWPLNLAQALRGAGGISPSVANIVAWDWRAVAGAALPPEEATPAQGIALGEALQQALGADYRQKVHFMGHSLGTLVNGYAVDYLHGHQRAGHRVAAQPWQASNTHVTMFDDAVISRLIAKETLIKLVLSGPRGYASSVALGWKNPVPHDFRWLDNYISSVGRYHPEAVNVVLQKGMLLALAEHSWIDAAVEAHSYPMTWYPRTVTSPSASIPGFGTSFEYAALHPSADFPPTGPEFVPGIAFRQSESSGDEMALELVTDLEVRLIYPALSVVGAEAPGVVSGWVETGIDAAASAGRKVGNAVVEVGQSVIVTVDEAVDRVVNGAGTVWGGLVDMLNRPDIRINMQTGPLLAIHGLHRAQAGADATNTPAAVWLPVVFPVNASMLAFNFAVEGDGKDDAVVFGINGTNLFTLATKFIPVGITNTSGIIDVSNYAGKTNELFFGVLGGTSTNCAVHIESIRFFTLTSQSLTIARTGGTTALSWPSTVNGVVLETATDLTAGAWSDVTNAPALFDGRVTVTNSWPDATRFFRLRER